MNLIITNQCNRSCPYCFAGRKINYPSDNKINNSTNNYIDMEAVDWYIDFTLRSGRYELKLLGGEPSLHPRLAEIVNRGLKQGLNVTIFTNGMWPRSVLSFFRKNTDPRIRFVFNLNEPGHQSSKENETQHRSLKVAGNRATVGFNIYREDFDLRFIKTFMDRFGLRRQIRLGLASPIVGADNVYLADKQLPIVGRRLVDQLKELETEGILGSFDCGFPMCIFSEEDLGSLSHTTVNGFFSFCGSVIDVGPDLSAWPCFPLSGLLNIYLPDFKNWHEVDTYYKNKTAPMRRFGSMIECMQCKYLRREQCSGGCLARTINAWIKAGDKQLVTKLNAGPSL